jgi:hypothetical protein
MWAEVFHADERTDGYANMTKTIIALHKFTEVFKRPYQSKCIYITPSFLIYYIFNTFVIRNILSFLCFWYYKYLFAELGRLYRYKSKSASLCPIRWWRTSDLLVWISADTKGKTIWLIVFVVGIIDVFYMRMEPHCNWEIIAQFEYWLFFCSARQSALNFLWQNLKTDF